MGKLTAKQRRFVDEYMVDHVGSRAAVRAGYSVNAAKQAARQLKQNPAVQAAISAAEADIREKLGVSAEWVVGKLVEVVEKSIAGTPKTTSTGQPVIVDGEMVFDWSPSGANKALELLAKHLGMQVEKHEHTVVGDIVYTLNLDRELPENEENKPSEDQK